jgi:hypothetical protein
MVPVFLMGHDVSNEPVAAVDDDGVAGKSRIHFLVNPEIRVSVY